MSTIEKVGTDEQELFLLNKKSFCSVDREVVRKEAKRKEGKQERTRLRQLRTSYVRFSIEPRSLPLRLATRTP
jgi:hypothetical protein